MSPLRGSPAEKPWIVTSSTQTHISARSMNAAQSAAVTAFGSDKRFSRTAYRIAMMRGTSACRARRTALAAWAGRSAPLVTARALRSNAAARRRSFFASSRGSHTRRLDEVLSGIVDAAAGPAAGRMDVELRGFRRLAVGGRRQRRLQRQFVGDRPGVVREHLLGVVDLAVVHDAAHEIGLPAHEVARHHAGERRRGPPAHVLAVENPLGVQELAIERRQRQPGRQHGMLDVEQAIIPRLQPALLGDPGLGARIGRVDADIHHLRHVHAPVAHDAEAILVPVRIGDDVDRDVDAQRARKFQRLEIAPERDTLAVLAQALLVDRLDAEEDVGEADLLPELEHLLVPQQHVAAGLQIELLADALAGDRLADREAVLLLDERDVVDDEGARLGDGGEILDHALRAAQPIAAAVERPGAAERAVPRAAAGELDRGAGIEHADEIFAALAHEVARGRDLVEVLDKAGAGTFAVGGDGAGHFGDRVAVAGEPLEQLDHARLALALEHAVDRALAVLQDGIRGEGGAVAADADEGAWLG